MDKDVNLKTLAHCLIRDFPRPKHLAERIRPMKTSTPPTSATSFESYTLTNDHGVMLQFSGRVYSEKSYHDEETGAITRLRLFMTSDKKQVYSIVTSTGSVKSHRYYTIRPDGDMCEINDGTLSMTVPTNMLFSVAFNLCGLDPATALEETQSSFEDTFNAAIAG